MYYLNNLRKRLRERRKGKRRRRERKQSDERGGDDARGHEMSLVMPVKEKATDNRDYNYSFQHFPPFNNESKTSNRRYIDQVLNFIENQ